MDKEIISRIEVRNGVFTMYLIDGEMVQEFEPSKESGLKSKGLGDVVAKGLKKIGFKPCGGCKKRQAKLNRIFPFSRKKREPDATLRGQGVEQERP